jgi:hypothetical protein
MSSGLLSTIVTGTVAAAHAGHPKLGLPVTEEELTKEREKKYDLGTVAHTTVLGVGREIVVIDAADWKTKAAQEARKAAFAAGKTPALLKTVDQAAEMRDALFQQLSEMPEERDTFGATGKAEEAGFAKVPTAGGGMWGRILCDWRSTASGRLVIRDYKTYGGQYGADPDGFVRGLISSGRDIQDPWYSMVAAIITSHGTDEQIAWDDVDFRFVVQDPNPPYLAVVVALDDRRWSYERMRWAVDKWALAARSNLWRGFSPLTHYIGVPTYARIAWEQRMLSEFQAEQAIAEDGRPALPLLDPETYAAPSPDRIEGTDEAPEVEVE